MLALGAAPAAAAPAPATLAAIEAVCLDYLDGQLEGDPARVARALHPDLAKRVARPANASEIYGLRRMSRDELINPTAQGAIKTPPAEWRRAVRILDVSGDIATARVETPWFTDYFHLARWGDRWLIVNALYQPKPQTAAARTR
jgi:hypothetical protein